MLLLVVVIQHRNEGIVTKRAEKNPLTIKSVDKDVELLELSYIAVRI